MLVWLDDAVALLLLEFSLPVVMPVSALVCLLLLLFVVLVFVLVAFGEHRIGNGVQSRLYAMCLGMARSHDHFEILPSRKSRKRLSRAEIVDKDWRKMLATEKELWI